MGKGEFLAMVTRELRPPLNATLDYTQMLRSGPVDRAAINISTEINPRRMAPAIESDGKWTAVIDGNKTLGAAFSY